jgi:receptor-type tyrosine-protein phosphatase gamma
MENHLLGLTHKMVEESIFLDYGPQPEHDLSFKYIEKCEDLSFIEKGIELKKFRSNMKKRNLELEFKLLRRLTENQMYTSNFRDYNPEIVKLDRYNPVVPFKHSMVRLHQVTESGGDAETYINANYITSSRKSESKTFIATQGPLESTRGHFWRMVWENQVSVIIMLCKCKEGGKNQSDQYWNQELEVDNFKIVQTDETDFASNLRRRTFKMKPCEGESQERTVTHYQWTAWPDHGTPSEEDVNIMEKLVDIIYETRTSNPLSPVVIHCSAGIGRSGTLVAIYNLDIILRECVSNLDNVKLSVFGVVRRLREQRWGMVNTSDQYSFIYKFVADRVDKFMTTSGNGQITQANN